MNPLYFSLGICTAIAIGTAFTSALYLAASEIADSGIRRRSTLVAALVTQILLILPECLLVFTRATDVYMRCHLHWDFPDVVSATFCIVAALGSAMTLHEMSKAMHPEDAHIVKAYGILSCLDFILFFVSVVVIIATFI